MLYVMYTCWYFTLCRSCFIVSFSFTKYCSFNATTSLKHTCFFFVALICILPDYTKCVLPKIISFPTVICFVHDMLSYLKTTTSVNGVFYIPHSLFMFITFRGIQYVLCGLAWIIWLYFLPTVPVVPRPEVDWSPDNAFLPRPCPSLMTLHSIRNVTSPVSASINMWLKWLLQTFRCCNSLTNQSDTDDPVFTTET